MESPLVGASRCYETVSPTDSEIDRSGFLLECPVDDSAVWMASKKGDAKMWKKAFIILLSLNLFVIVGGTMWWGSLPKTSAVSSPTETVQKSDKPATIQLSLGADAINSYLEYALSEQADVQRVLAYGSVAFSDTWQVQVGLKLKDRVVPCTFVFTPQVDNGNLVLHVESATMGDIPAPLGALFFVMLHVSWPSWIVVDATNHNIHVNFTERPQLPYGVRVLSYSPTTKQISMQVTIVPKSLLQSTQP